ncbi:hypothetical protein QVD17_11671 [Tagetes erecta]|uniref:Transmembrane protein n=1 Tax=Tagetes erecta TaxID=13708 RepID=A0AAD8L019_TARER|nr:hypothetical protein QVD17_11671 [Tagetes erecta]
MTMNKLMRMQIVMLLVLMVLFLTQDMGYAMKKRNMMMVDDNDGGKKLTSMETDQELEPNNHHWIPRGSWQSGQFISDDVHA